jgi:hypothetical protein
MSDKSRYIKSAQERLTDLVSHLQRLPQQGAIAEAVAEAAHLARAIDTFHLEAIRFRIFNLSRRLQDPSCPVDDAIRQGILDVRTELEKAGFQTRSVST